MFLAMVKQHFSQRCCRYSIKSVKTQELSQNETENSKHVEVFSVLWGVKGRRESLNICSKVHNSWLHELSMVVMPDCRQNPLM